VTERQAEELLETLDTLERGIVIVLALGGILLLFVIADLIGAVRDWWRTRRATSQVLLVGEADRSELDGARLNPLLPSPHPIEFEFVRNREKSPNARDVLKGGELG
jgi:hypothetical protein